MLQVVAVAFVDLTGARLLYPDYLVDELVASVSDLPKEEPVVEKRVHRRAAYSNLVLPFFPP